MHHYGLDEGPDAKPCVEDLFATDRVAWEPSMTEEKAPPAPLPSAAAPPYPEHPAPHPQRDEALENPPVAMPQGPAIGALGITLIGGAVAAAVGLLVAVPLLRRGRKSPAPKSRPASRARRPRRKRDEG